ncbi:MAG: 50S ribosomal protein L9 [Bacteroidetes bacterium HGW-Bacteroidetes-21]|jgi:large subunit ribosomal protein L9|nr:MAG: 50S ribosomal protein L9 [Bacteroidetes bacterium HGW-Bacteroidetes-21]
MEIILKQDIQNLGHKDDLVKVKDGYARNFLVPKGMAVIATVSAKKVHAENTKQRAHKEEKLKADAAAQAKKLENKLVRIAAKTSTTGKIFGSVNTIQIAEALEKDGILVDRRNITIFDQENIKEIGTFRAKAKIYREISAEFDFEVYSE